MYKNRLTCNEIKLREFPLRAIMRLIMHFLHICILYAASAPSASFPVHLPHSFTFQHLRTVATSQRFFCKSQQSLLRFLVDFRKSYILFYSQLKSLCLQVVFNQYSTIYLYPCGNAGNLPVTVMALP